MSRSPLLVLCAVIFLQMVCVGSNFPTLNTFGEELGMPAALLGLLWAAFALPRAVATPFWGSLSDRWGRKPVMLLGSAGTLAGSVLWLLSDSWGMLVASRAVDALLSAQATIAFAIVADITPREKRSAGMGLLGGVVSLAIIIGAPAGALWAETFGFRSVGWLTGGLELASFLLVLFALPETKAKAGSRGGAALSGAGRVLASPAVFWLLVSTFIFTAAYTPLNTALQKSTASWYDYTERHVGYAFALLGLASAIVQGGLVRRLAPRYGERTLAWAGMAMVGAAFTVMGAIQNAAIFWTAVALVGTGIGFVMPSLTARLSHMVAEEDQGLAGGLSQTAQTLGRALGPVLGSLLFVHAGPSMPFFCGAAVAMLSALLLLPVRPDTREAAVPECAAEPSVT